MESSRSNNNTKRVATATAVAARHSNNTGIGSIGIITLTHFYYSLYIIHISSAVVIIITKHFSNELFHAIIVIVIIAIVAAVAVKAELALHGIQHHV